MTAHTHTVSTAEGRTLVLEVFEGAGTGADLVVVPSAFGLAEDVRAQLQAFAAHARRVISYDPFQRTDPGVVPYGDMPRVMRRIQALDVPGTRADLRAALAFASASDSEPGGAVGGGARHPRVLLGVCFGGPFALDAAADGLADGVATWHGTRIDQRFDRAAEVKCPVRLHFGGIDPIVPLSTVASIQAAFAAHPDAQVVVHGGASHGFTHAQAPAWHPSAAAAAVAAVEQLVCMAVCSEA